MVSEAAGRSQAVDEGIRQLYESGVCLAFIRHGNTLSAAKDHPGGDAEADFERVLSDKGREQARLSAQSFLLGNVITSVPLVVHSTAGRARQTAELMFGEPACEARFGACRRELSFRPANTIYPGVDSRASPNAELAAAVVETEKYFSQISYAPLSRYFDRGCTEDVWREYAEHVLEEVLSIIDDGLIQRPEVLAIAATEAKDNSGTYTCVCVFGHAQYSQALALRVAMAIGLEMEQVARIAEITLGEAEGILVTPSGGVVQLLRK